jgi:hypothetical protein
MLSSPVESLAMFRGVDGESTPLPRAQAHNDGLANYTFMQGNAGQSPMERCRSNEPKCDNKYGSHPGGPDGARTLVDLTGLAPWWT